jgi:hypothetical protein
MSHRPHREVRRVDEADLEQWQRDLLAESRRISREEREFAASARAEARRARPSPDDRRPA